MKCGVFPPAGSGPAHADPGFPCGFCVFCSEGSARTTRSHARGMDAFKLMKELRLNYEQEVHYLPKKTGLSLIASSVQVRRRPVLPGGAAQQLVLKGNFGCFPG